MTICGMTPEQAYQYYTDTFGGTMLETDFKRHYAAASALMTAMCIGRVSEAQDEITTDLCMMAVCEASEHMYRVSQSAGGTEGGGVVAETNDGVSVTYASSHDNRTDEQKISGIFRKYLAATGLLYRGVGGRRW